MKNPGVKAISSGGKSFNKMQTERNLTNISKRLKRSWNLYAKNVICIQKIVLLSERYFYITVSLKLYKRHLFYHIQIVLCGFLILGSVSRKSR